MAVDWRAQSGSQPSGEGARRAVAASASSASAPAPGFVFCFGADAFAFENAPSFAFGATVDPAAITSLPDPWLAAGGSGSAPSAEPGARAREPV
jgi:hypothetical protein